MVNGKTFSCVCARVSVFCLLKKKQGLSNVDAIRSMNPKVLNAGGSSEYIPSPSHNEVM